MHTGKKPSRGRVPGVNESGTVATGHPANNVITPHGGRHDATDDAGIAPGGKLRGTNYMQRDGVPPEDDAKGLRGHEAGTRGSGTPVESGAGQLADDRPGRDAPKGS